jgi:hypothetical protein
MLEVGCEYRNVVFSIIDHALQYGKHATSKVERHLDGRLCTDRLARMAAQEQGVIRRFACFFGLAQAEMVSLSVRDLRDGRMYSRDASVQYHGRELSVLSKYFQVGDVDHDRLARVISNIIITYTPKQKVFSGFDLIRQDITRFDL